MFDPENDLVTSENILTGTCISWQSTFLSSRGNHVKAPSGCREVILSTQGTKRSRLSSVIARNVAISPDSCHRGERGDLAFPAMANNERRDCFAGSPRFVIARNEAISPFQRWQTEKREIAVLRSPRFVIARNEAISPFQRWQTEKREIAALRSPRFVIARNEASSVFYRWQTAKTEIAALRSLRFVIARNEAISVFYRWRTAKERLPRYARNDKKCSREGRSDLGFLPMANNERRDCFAGPPRFVIARNEAISPFQRWQTEKREIAALRSPRFVIARNEAISVFYRWRTAKREIAALRSQ